MVTEKCKNCTYYIAYYQQFSSSYARLNHGYCQKHSEPKIQFENCSVFKSNERKKENRAKIRMQNLEKALISINEIAQILKEDESNIF